jgi:pSer/pThr/pTyr-binding forkhead associated (FHA) protein
MNKLNYILNEINTIKSNGVHVKNAKCIKIKYYKLHKQSLNDIDIINIKKHSFIAEVLKLSEVLEKKILINKIVKNVTKIEVHKFVPEINKIHFKNSFINAPNVISINKVSVNKQLENCNYTTVNKYLNLFTINKLKNILLTIK